MAIITGPKLRVGAKIRDRQPKEGGIFDKGESRNPAGRTPMIDHGCKVYKDSDWGLKRIERSQARNIPLLSEFTRYGEWGGSSKRWANKLYNHPAISGADYFINNIKSAEVQ